MKRYLFICIAALLAASCVKEEPVAIEKLLTRHTWKADQIRTQFSSGVYEFYKRGGSNNIANYDSDSLRFNLDNTGYFLSQGRVMTTTWEFTSSQKDKLRMTINFPEGAEQLNWENISVTTNQLQYVQYPAQTNKYLASCIRVPN